MRKGHTYEKTLMKCTPRERYRTGVLYEIKDSKGQAMMTGYSVYPGIMIMYMDIHRPELSCEAKPMPDVFAINHCETGRIECNFKTENTCTWEKGICPSVGGAAVLIVIRRCFLWLIITESRCCLIYLRLRKRWIASWV